MQRQTRYSRSLTETDQVKQVTYRDRPGSAGHLQRQTRYSRSLSETDQVKQVAFRDGAVSDGHMQYTFQHKQCDPQLTYKCTYRISKL